MRKADERMNGAMHRASEGVETAHAEELENMEVMSVDHPPPSNARSSAVSASASASTSTRAPPPTAPEAAQRPSGKISTSNTADDGSDKP